MSLYDFPVYSVSPPNTYTRPHHTRSSSPRASPSSSSMVLPREHSRHYQQHQHQLAVPRYKYAYPSSTSSSPQSYEDDSPLRSALLRMSESSTSSSSSENHHYHDERMHTYRRINLRRRSLDEDYMTAWDAEVEEEQEFEKDEKVGVVVTEEVKPVVVDGYRYLDAEIHQSTLEEQSHSDEEDGVVYDEEYEEEEEEAGSEESHHSASHNLRRQWESMSLAWRVKVFRAKRSVKRKVGL